MKRKLFKKTFKALFYISLCCLLASLTTIIVFKYSPIPYTPLMALRSLENRKNTNYQIRESALIASCFPNPLQRNPLYPSQNMEIRVNTIEWIMSWLQVPKWLQKLESGIAFNYPSVQEDTSSQSVYTSSWFVYGDQLYDYVIINLSDKVTYHSFQEINPNRIVVDLFGVTNNTTWIAQYPTKEVDNAYCRQISDDIVRIYIDLHSKLHWGYSIYYEADRFMIRVKHPPKPRLKGLCIVLDAGHGGDVNGAIGVTGLKEKDINLELVMLLKAQLEKRGAQVVLTRNGDYDVSMDQRLDFLSRQMPDILISIHNNASTNSSIKGTSTYYRHIGFRPLSTAILKQLLDLGLQNAGNIGSFNFALNAPTEYPNVLIEGLFLSNPEDEAKLADKRFKKRFVKKIAKGVEEFMKCP